MHKVAIDTETCLIEPGKLAPELVCVSYADKDDSGVLAHRDAHDFVSALLDGDYVLLGLNMAYDMAVLGNEFPDLLPAIFGAYFDERIRDVGLDQRLIDIAKGRAGFYSKQKGAYSLAGLCKRLLKLDLEKEDSPRLTYGRLRGLPLSAYSQDEIEYARLDAVRTLDVHEHQVQVEKVWLKKRQPGLFENSPAQAQHAFSLHLATCWGVRSDARRCAVLAQALEREIDTARALLQEHGLVRANGTRNLKAAAEHMEHVCAKRNLPVPRTIKGGVSLDKDAVGASGDPVLQAYSTFVGANTLRQRVQDIWRGAYVPLQPSYSVLRETGRTSSRKPSAGSPTFGVQIQNFPRLEGARECLEPRQGYIFIDADFSAAEMHSLAQVLLDMFGTSALADLLRTGVDSHVHTAAALLGRTYEDVNAAKDRKNLRNFAKAFAFGVPGGLGVTTFVQYASANYGVHMTPKEAAHHILTFKRNVFPDIGRYLDTIGEVTSRPEPILYPWVKRWRGGVTYTSCANGYFQARTADGALEALDYVQQLAYTEPSSPLYGVRTHGFIHDEIRAEATIPRARAAAEELGRVMAEVYNRVSCPDVPTVAEPTMAWRWSKGTDPVRDESGRLMVSDPHNAPDWYRGELEVAC